MNRTLTGAYMQSAAPNDPNKKSPSLPYLVRSSVHRIPSLLISS